MTYFSIRDGWIFGENKNAESAVMLRILLLEQGNLGYVDDCGIRNKRITERKERQKKKVNRLAVQQ